MLYKSLTALRATILRAETTKAVTELLAQMTALLNSPSEPLETRQTAFRDLSAVVVAQARQIALPELLSPSPQIHWVGSTMVV